MLGLLQIIGAVAVLIAFIAVQRGTIHPKSLFSLLLNLLGSGLLAVLALIGHQWGFLLLEGSWAAISAASFRGRQRAIT